MSRILLSAALALAVLGTAARDAKRPNMATTTGEPIITITPRPRALTSSFRSVTLPNITLIARLEAIPITGNTGHGHS